MSPVRPEENASHRDALAILSLYPDKEHLYIGSPYDKLECPEELSVLGAENTPFVENTRPALSTLVVPMEKDGAMCVEQVIRAWGKPSKPIQLASEIGLVERESVSVPRG